MKYVTGYVETVKHNERHPRKAPTASFFYRFSIGTLQRTLHGLFRSLLYQLFVQIPSYMTDFLFLFRKKCQMAGKPGIDWDWQFSELQQYLRTYLSRALQQYKVYMFVDALDEYEGDNANQIVEFFQDILARSSATSFHLCMSSRYSPEFLRGRDLEIWVDDENQADLSRFIRSELERGILGDDETQLIERQILRRAHGVFLWVTLIVRQISIAAEKGESFDSLLSTWPTELNSVYRIILDRIQDTSADWLLTVREVFTWVLLGSRPLTVGELREAITIRNLSSCEHSLSPPVSRSCEPPPQEPVISLREQADMGRILKNLSGGLLETRSIDIDTSNRLMKTASDVVVLVHQSVRAFLLRDAWQILEPTSFTYSEAVSYGHLRIATHCIEYLAADAIDNVQSDLRTLASRFPLLEYATAYWPWHARAAEVADVSQERLLTCFSWPSDQIVRRCVSLQLILSGHTGPHASDGSTLLHIAAGYGLHKLMIGLFSIDQNPFDLPNVRDSMGRTPLHWAALSGSTAVVRLLLDKGADVKAKDHQYGRPPWSWAAWRGHESALELLLDAGADIDEMGCGSSALSIAAASGHRAVVNLLLMRGANPNMVDYHHGQSPLSLAASRGHGAVISPLLKFGADVDYTDLYGWTPLHHAVQSGHIAVANLLLNCVSRSAKPVIWREPRGSFTWVDRVVRALLMTVQRRDVEAIRTHAEQPQQSCSFSGPTTGQSGTLQPRATAKRKRSSDEDDSGSRGGGRGNRPNKHPSSGPSAANSPDIPSLKLACPYFKHSPGKYGQVKRCRGPTGWSNMHRLK